MKFVIGCLLDLVALISIAWHQILSFFGIGRIKDPHVVPGKTPILLIHGFLGNHSNWSFHMKKLTHSGIQNIFTIDLGSPFLSIEEYARKVHEKVQEIKRKTGRDDLIFVCHSMGGLVAEVYLETFPEYIHHVPLMIAIGTPFQGTRLARLLAPFCKAAREMLPTSSFIHERSKVQRKCPLLYIGSSHDFMVPLRSSVPENASNSFIEEKSGHFWQLRSNDIQKVISSKLIRLQQ